MSTLGDYTCLSHWLSLIVSPCLFLSLFLPLSVSACLYSVCRSQRCSALRPHIAHATAHLQFHTAGTDTDKKWEKWGKKGKNGGQYVLVTQAVTYRFSLSLPLSVSASLCVCLSACSMCVSLPLYAVLAAMYPGMRDRCILYRNF